METQTKDLMPWRLRDSHQSAGGALTEDEIALLAVRYDVDPEGLRRLTLKFHMALSRKLNLSQPELRNERIKKGLKTVKLALKELRSAESHLSKLEQFLNEVRFFSPLPAVSIQPAVLGHTDSLRSSIESLNSLRVFLDAMARNELVLHTGTLDKRYLRDIRRTMVCLAIFNFWVEIDRRLTYSTDPMTSRRGGQLFEFINSVVTCLTSPPTPLNDDTIKRELEEFLAACTEEFVSGTTRRKKNDHPT